MSDLEQTQQGERDGAADAVAVIAIIAIVVGTVVFWLHSLGH